MSCSSSRREKKEIQKKKQTREWRKYINLTEEEKIILKLNNKIKKKIFRYIFDILRDQSNKKKIAA